MQTIVQVIAIISVPLIAPLIALLSTQVKYQWTQAATLAIAKIKQHFPHCPSLSSIDPTRKCTSELT
ncbi:hypothetical protein PR048_012882 [Dryococelus australis]|uniref:Uncharacterized protein n=1 Tax=Dryococelus australis TaxID=614101 RepID=A0ABQ9HQW8_9NEOP|nr:hypothetical protein PR048_012882 [Dryococelus australis]